MNLNSLFSLDGKVALVTGGSSGIGAMIAEGFVSAGATVYICSRNIGKGQETAEALRHYPGQCHAVEADVSTMAGIDALVELISGRENSVGVLVNNAGAIRNQAFSEFSEDDWDSVMNLNARTAFFLTQKMLPLLRNAASEEDPARVINIGSVQGARANSMWAYSYCASKAALTQLTKNLAFDLARENIAVAAIAPGFFPSNMTAPIIENQTANDAMLKRVRMGRVGKKEELAALAIYMASKSGAYLTGETVFLDGGLILSG